MLLKTRAVNKRTIAWIALPSLRVGIERDDHSQAAIDEISQFRVIRMQEAKVGTKACALLATAR